MMLYQSYFYERNKPAEMLNDKYLAVLNTFQSPNAITILDSNSYDNNDHTEQSTVINIIDSSVSVSSLNIADKDAIKFVALAGKSIYKNNFDVSSYGTRCTLSEDEKSIYVKTDTNTLTQYSMEDGKKKVDIVTEHPVYSFWVVGDICRVVEKEEYYNEIFDTIIRLNRAKELIVAIAGVIQKLVVTRLHVIGDIFDRGPGPHIIMDHLMEHSNVDFQWGNHDVVWMGAASGQKACIANVIRLSARYNNLNVLEDGYGINLVPLASFAIETYANDPCQCFRVHAQEDSDLREVSLNMKMHKAIAIIQFKLEGQVIKRRPEFNMDKRLLLDKIDYEEGTIMIEGKKYELLDKSFPTIDPNNPYELSEAEEALMNRLCMNYKNCDKLQEHIRFLFNKGCLYLCYNSNLLYHGCVPLDEKGNFRKVKIGSKQYSGKELYDVLEYYARKGYYEQDNREEHEYGKDIMWYIWSNENSPVYGKEKMATFERYFIADKEVQIERKDHYYRLIEREDVVNNILKEFGVDIEKGHIINGHMPVHVKEGESPVKCNGKVMIIDGGFSKAYRGTTGIAGYTLIYNSRGLRLVSHETFTSTEDVIEKEIDVHSDTVIREVSAQRERVIDTETGRQLKEQISDLEKLLHAYRTGQILEKE